jgi:hypothetical protein
VSDRASLVFSLESDLLTSAGFIKTRTSPRWSSAFSDTAAPSLGRVARFCSARGQHAPGRSLPVPAREGYDMISRVRLVVFGVSGVSGGHLLKREVPSGGACSPRAGDGASDASFLCWCSVVGLFCVFFSTVCYVLILT